MSEHPNVQRIHEAYGAFSAGDLTSALKDFATEGVLYVGGSGPHSGSHLGADAIGSALIGIFEMTAGTQKLEIHSVFADDRRGIVTLRETATRPDGATLDVDEAHLITFDDAGQITNLWDVPSDPEAHDRFFDGR